MRLAASSSSGGDRGAPPAIRAFYQRLIQARKPSKVAITACMRKLLTILNTLSKNRTR